MLTTLNFRQGRTEQDGIVSRASLVLSMLPPGRLAAVLVAIAELWPLLQQMLNEMTVQDEEVKYFSLGGLVDDIGGAISGAVEAVGEGWKEIGSWTTGALTKEGRDRWGGLGDSGLLSQVPVIGGVLQSGATLIKGIDGKPKGASSSGSGAAVAMIPNRSPDSVLSATKDYLSTTKAWGPMAGLQMLEQNYPLVFTLLRAVTTASRDVTAAEISRLPKGLSSGTKQELTQLYTPMAKRMGLNPERIMADRVLRDADTNGHERCEPCEANINLGTFSGSLPRGEFFRSRLITASVTPGLGGGVHGEVNLSRMPFKIRVSRDNTPARAEMVVAHELAHVANKVYKLGLPHRAVHDLGVFYATEGLPLYSALLEHLESGKPEQSFWHNAA
jgi:hypothetical protein